MEKQVKLRTEGARLLRLLDDANDYVDIRTLSALTGKGYQNTRLRLNHLFKHQCVERIEFIKPRNPDYEGDTRGGVSPAHKYRISATGRQILTEYIRVMEMPKRRRTIAGDRIVLSGKPRIDRLPNSVFDLARLI